MKEQAKPTHPKNENDNAGLKETPAAQADDTLRAIEPLTRIFLDSSLDMAFLKDEKFRHIIANQALCKFYGKTESEIIGKTDFDLMDKKAADECRKTDEQTLRSNDLQISEEVVGDRVYETRKFPVDLAEGKKGVGAYIRDITERKQAEDELRESERKFRETVFNLDEGYYSVTLDGVLLEHNQAFCRILGFDQAADLKGKQMPDFWQNPDERNSYLKELAAKGSIKGYQAKAKTKTGEKITVIISAHFVKDKDSLPLRIEGVVLDITERKRFEDQLRASEARLRAIVDSTPFPMALVDVEDDKIEYWSRGALELFGHTAPTATEWYQLAYPDPEYRRDVIERWKPFLEKARLCGKPVNTGEYRVSCHDGSVRICELYATFLSDRLIVTFNDITERVQAEEALRIREKDLRESQRIAHVGNWSLKIATNQVVWSEELYKMYGFDPALPPPPYTDHMKLFTPKSWERLSTALAHTRETGIPYTLELETVREDGSNGWMWVHGEVDVDSAGKTVGLWGVAQDITARKQADQELKRSENLLQKVFDVLPIGLWFADKDGKLLRGNPAGVKIWGAEPKASPSEYGVFKARRLPSGEELAPGDWSLAHTIREGVTIVDELLEIDAFDGKKKVILNYTAPVLDENGTIQGAVVANLDITEQKRAEELLRLKNHVFDSSIAANSIADVAGVITETNDSFLKIWGYSSKDEVIGNSMSYFLNDQEEAVAIFNALNGKGSWQGNYTAKKKDGSTFIAHSIANTIRDINGKLTGYQSSVMDITEHKRSEEALREKETQYRALADSGLAIIWTAGTDKLCNYFNQPWLKFTGRTLEQEMGNGWTEGVHPEDLDRCVQIYVTAFDKREAFDMEYRLRHASGEYRWILDLGTPNYNASGEFIGYIGHCFDITEKKTAEDLIKKLNETLEQRIKERTSELQENIDLLEETNRAFVGRELRIIELKERIAELEKKEK